MKILTCVMKTGVGQAPRFRKVLLLAVALSLVIVSFQISHTAAGNLDLPVGAGDRVTTSNALLMHVSQHNSNSPVISLAGDQDSFGTGAPPGTPVRLVDFQPDATGSFDQWCTPAFAWSHTFTIPTGATLTGASLTIVTWDLEDAGAGDTLGGGPFDTKLFLDGVEVPLAFDDTFSPDTDTLTPILPNTTVFALSPEMLPSLQDGRLDVTVNAFGGQLIDCVSIDYALLQVNFTTTINVPIDIKPGVAPNTINLGSNGNVPVAILSTASFDARTVDPTTVTLAGASVKLKGNGMPNASFQDVNHDGLVDLLVHITTAALQLSEVDTEAILEGQCLDGTSIRGVDTIRVVP